MIKWIFKWIFFGLGLDKIGELGKSLRKCKIFLMVIFFVFGKIVIFIWVVIFLEIW